MSTSKARTVDGETTRQSLHAAIATFMLAAVQAVHDNQATCRKALARSTDRLDNEPERAFSGQQKRKLPMPYHVVFSYAETVIYDGPSEGENATTYDTFEEAKAAVIDDLQTFINKAQANLDAVKSANKISDLWYHEGGD